MKFIIVILIWLICDNIVFYNLLYKLQSRIDFLESDINSLRCFEFLKNTDKEC